MTTTLIGTDRDTLRSQLAECDRLEALSRELQAQTIACETAIDAAVELHANETASIQAALSTVVDVETRLKLRADLDAANQRLDSECKLHRGRIPGLQQEAIATIYSIPPRGRIEWQLLDSAPDDLKDALWRVKQDIEWCDLRRTNARKSLKAAEAKLLATSGPNRVSIVTEEDQSAARLWREEFEHIDALAATLAAESEELRQKMISE